LVLGLRKAERLESESGNRLADMVSLFVEYVKGIPLLKAFSESKKFDQELESSTQLIVSFGSGGITFVAGDSHQIEQGIIHFAGFLLQKQVDAVLD
jgi:hypothetical protein